MTPCSSDVLVMLQVISLFFLHEKSVWFLIAAAYCFGGVIHHSLLLAAHKISCNLSFPSIFSLMENRLYGFFDNLLFSVFYSSKYHLKHHRYQSKEVVDTRYANIFCPSFGEFCWVCLQPFFYLTRLFVVDTKPLPMLKGSALFSGSSCSYIAFHWHL